MAIVDERPSTESIRRAAGSLAALASVALWPVKHYLPFQIQSKLLYYRFSGHSMAGHPHRLREVRPDDIELMISKTAFGGDQSGYIVGGDWDRRAYPFEDNAIYGMFADHFVRGVEWEETDGFQAQVAKIENGERIGGLDTAEQTVDQYREYLDYWDEVYRKIERDGYKTQRALVRDDDFINRRPSITGEINVYIGRNGEFICWSGKHRLTIAKLLELDAVPVRVVVRHSKWHETREAIADADSLEALDAETAAHLDHPDVRDLVADTLT